MYFTTSTHTKKAIVILRHSAFKYCGEHAKILTLRSSYEGTFSALLEITMTFFPSCSNHYSLAKVLTKYNVYIQSSYLFDIKIQKWLAETLSNLILL